jgi:deoxyadenosine/deoxycytidine kinase
MSRIVIDGSISCGKSTFLNRLKMENKNINVVLENVDDWKPFLDSYYKDINSNALQMKIFYDQTCYNYFKDKVNVYERSPYSLKYAFGCMLYDQNILSKHEYDLQNNFVDKFGWIPTRIIYIDVSPEVCYKRCIEKGVTNISLEYLKMLEIYYENAIIKYRKNICVSIIDGEKEKEEIYREILDIINLES